MEEQESGDSKEEQESGEFVEQETCDWISSLPDDILTHILSFLDFYDVYRTGFLSKRWRNLWRSMPNLVISERDFSWYVVPFLNRVLSDYDRSCNIRYCDLDLWYDGNMKSEMDSSIQFLAQLKVQYLRLDFDGYYRYDLPAVFYCSQTLTKLRLRFVRLYGLASVSFPSLKSLHLGDSDTVDAVVLTRIIDGAPLLSCLKLDSCDYSGDVRIHDCRGTLKKLEITCKDADDHDHMMEVGFEIYASNLTRFTYEGPLPEQGFEVSEFPFLLDADLHFEKLVEYPSDDEVEYSNIALIVLHAVRHAKSLTLCPWTVQVMCELELFNLTPISFDCSHLTVNTTMQKDTDLIGVFHVLRNSKSLKYLSLVIHNSTGYHDYAHIYDAMEELNFKDKIFPICLKHFECVDITEVDPVSRKYRDPDSRDFALMKLILGSSKKLLTMRILLKDSGCSEGVVKQLWHSLSSLSVNLGRGSTTRIVIERVPSKKPYSLGAS